MANRRMHDWKAFLARLEHEVNNPPLPRANVPNSNRFLTHRLHTSIYNKLKDSTSEEDFHERYNSIMDDLQGVTQVIVKVDKKTRMASVYYGDEGMIGNFGDFYNGCHGMYDLPVFRTHMQLAKILQEKHKATIKYDDKWVFEK